MADASGLEAMRSSSQSAPSLASLRATRPALPKPVRGGAQRLPAVAGARKPPAKKPSSAPKRVTIAEPGEHTPEAPGEVSARGRAVGAFNLAKPKHPNFAESEWENELARSILVLYGSAMGADEDVEGAENDFAIDRDAVRVPRDKITREEVRAGAAREARDKRRTAAAREARDRKKRENPFKHPERPSSAEAKPRKAFPLLSAKVQPIWFLGSGPIPGQQAPRRGRTVPRPGAPPRRDRRARRPRRRAPQALPRRRDAPQHRRRAAPLAPRRGGRRVRARPRPRPPVRSVASLRAGRREHASGRRPIEAVRRRARRRRFFSPAQAQNARRLARLCLSYSNRWLDKFESTHRCAAEALSAMGGGLAEGLDKARGRGKGGRGDGGRLTLTHGAAPKERRKTVMIAAG